MIISGIALLLFLFVILQTLFTVIVLELATSDLLKIKCGFRTEKENTQTYILGVNLGVNLATA